MVSELSPVIGRSWASPPSSVMRTASGMPPNTPLSTEAATTSRSVTGPTLGRSMQIAPSVRRTAPSGETGWL